MVRMKCQKGHESKKVAFDLPILSTARTSCRRGMSQTSPDQLFVDFAHKRAKKFDVPVSLTSIAVA